MSNAAVWDGYCPECPPDDQRLQATRGLCYRCYQRALRRGRLDSLPRVYKSHGPRESRLIDLYPEVEQSWEPCASVAEALGPQEDAAIRRLVEHVRRGGTVNKNNEIEDGGTNGRYRKETD